MRTIYFILLTLLPVSLWAASFKVVELKGSPFYRPAGSLKKETFAKGADLKAGGRIKMADGDLVSLKTPMGDTIELSGSTYMKLENLDSTKGKTKVSLELFKGIATNKVSKLGPESSFTIRTPSAVAGVRGTEFQVAVSETGETEVDVMEGEVGVAASDSPDTAVPVKAGKSAKVKKGGGISVKVIKNIKKRAARRAARAAKVSESKTSAGKADAGADKSAAGSGDAGASTDSGAATDTGASADTTDVATGEVETDVVSEEVIVEEVDTEAITEAVNEEVSLVIEEVNDEIQQTIDEEVIDEATTSSLEDISVDLESINR